MIIFNILEVKVNKTINYRAKPFPFSLQTRVKILINSNFCELQLNIVFHVSTIKFPF